MQLFRENGEETEEIKDDNRVRMLNDDTGDMLNAYQMKKAWVTDYYDGRGYIYINRHLNEVQSLHYVEKNQISISKNANPIFKDADIYIITVPTPINDNNEPDLTPLTQACEGIGKCLSMGNIVVLESTVYPGATEEFSC